MNITPFRPSLSFKANEFMKNPSEYADKKYPLNGEKSKTILYTPKDPASSHKPFISWPDGVGVVHALTVFKNKSGEVMTRLVVQERPAMGGVKTIEAPAGKYGENGSAEDALEGAEREVEEETGLTPLSVTSLASAPFTTSPGITNELKDFALVTAKDEGKERELTESEIVQKADCMDIPLTTLTDNKKFMQWQDSMKEKGYVLNIDIPVLKGLIAGNVEAEKEISQIK